ncbi:hypothetical protein HYV91_03240 [Candidatus Wolfebacteria bacterium]|nr:hypothetical protein [Candidatus Wolfebacteria bacterium]
MNRNELAQLRRIFEDAMTRDGKFLYVPGEASEELRNGKATDVGFLLNFSDPDSKWFHHPLFPRIVEINRGERPLFPANLVRWEEWCALNNEFGLDKEYGHLSFRDGSVICFISAHVMIGTRDASRTHWGISRYGWLVLVSKRYSPYQVARIAHLMEEFLHRVRQNDPAVVVRAAKFLESQGAKILS